VFRRRRRPPLRYYLYVSNTKLDMLFEQIDPALRRRISAEAKVDLKLASLTLRRADTPTRRHVLGEQPATEDAHLFAADARTQTALLGPGHQYRARLHPEPPPRPLRTRRQCRRHCQVNLTMPCRPRHRLPAAFTELAHAI